LVGTKIFDERAKIAALLSQVTLKMSPAGVEKDTYMEQNAPISQAIGILDLDPPPG
jgi:hypothetical protein